MKDDYMNFALVIMMAVNIGLVTYGLVARPANWELFSTIQVLLFTFNGWLLWKRVEL